jgi:hypothetical protein
MSSSTPQPTLADELRDAIVAEFKGVKLIVSPKGDYYTVKLDSTTLGYVNGKKKLRVDFPKRGGKREQLVVEKRQQIAKAITTLRKYEPTILDRETAAEKKATKSTPVSKPEAEKIAADVAADVAATFIAPKKTTTPRKRAAKKS